MAQRPPVVAPTSTPAGQLQLHYFSERTSFHCVHCQRDKTASLVATMGPDWTQAVCIICYGALVSAQPEKADTAAKAKPRPVQAKQQPSRKVKPKQPDETPPQPTAKKARRQFKGYRRPAATDDGGMAHVPGDERCKHDEIAAWCGESECMAARMGLPVRPPKPRRIKVKRAGHDMKCPVCGELIRKDEEITTDGAGYPQHANPLCRPRGRSERAKYVVPKLPGTNCPLCGEGFPRLTRTPESEPVPWRGGYAHQGCADKQDRRDIGAWQSGSSGPRRRAPGDMG